MALVNGRLDGCASRLSTDRGGPRCWGGMPARAETDQRAALVSAGRRERWLFSPGGPASAAPSAPRSETAACPQGDADQGGASAAPAPSGGGPRALSRPSRHQEHPRNSPGQEGTACYCPCPRSGAREPTDGSAWRSRSAQIVDEPTIVSFTLALKANVFTKALSSCDILSGTMLGNHPKPRLRVFRAALSCALGTALHRAQPSAPSSPASCSSRDCFLLVTPVRRWEAFGGEVPCPRKCLSPRLFPPPSLALGVEGVFSFSELSVGDEVWASSTPCEFNLPEERSVPLVPSCPGGDPPSFW